METCGAEEKAMTSQECVSKRQENTTDLEALQKLFDLHWQVADYAQKLTGTAQRHIGMELMTVADQIGAEIDELTERCGYTIEEVTAPFHQKTPRAA
jgi:hypothetical protein